MSSDFDHQLRGAVHLVVRQTYRRPPKEQLLVLCQGCPGLAQVQRRIEQIAWAADVPEIATWIEDNLELDISRPSKHFTTSWIQTLQGWKGAHDSNEPRSLEGELPLYPL